MPTNQFPVRPSDTDLHLPLHDYQKLAKELILTQPFCGLFLDCGFGKTLITLAAIYDLNPQGHVLVVAPKVIAASTWQKEIDKWKIPIRTKSLIVNEKGKPLSRKKRLERYAEVTTDPPTMYFINRELLPDLIDNMPKNEKGRPVWYFPIVILDEAQSFKSHTSLRFKKLKYVRPTISRLVELTGTPAPKSLMDLWAEIYLLDEGARLGRTITAYRNTYFTEGIHVNNFAVTWNLIPGMDRVIHDKVKDIVFSIKNPGIRLPDVTYNDICVDMDQSEYDMYKELMQEKVLNMGETEIMAANAGVLQAKLMQMASGTLYLDEAHTVAVIHDKKLEILRHIIDTTGSPVLIAYWFNCDRDRILKAIPKAKAFDGSGQMQDEWNRGEIPAMLLHPASSGFGINLQDGGHTLVWYTVPWSLEMYLQTNARLARQGQKNPVVIHHILTEKTIDRKIVRALQQKDASEQALLEAVSLTVKEALKK